MKNQKFQENLIEKYENYVKERNLLKQKVLQKNKVDLILKDDFGEADWENWDRKPKWDAIKHKGVFIITEFQV